MKKTLCVGLIVLLMAVAFQVQASQDADLGSDIYGFVISIDGDIIGIPATFASMEALGWTFKVDRSSPDNLESMQYARNLVFAKGKGEVEVSLINLGEETVAVGDSLVGEVDVQSSKIGGLKVLLPGGIQLGESTPEAVVAAYGDPSNVMESSYHTCYTYSWDLYQSVELYFDPANDMKLKEINMQNFVPQEYAATQQQSGSADDGEIPAVVEAYTAPAELGNDPFSFNVEYEGKLYTIPAPFTEFAADGWVIEEGDGHRIPGYTIATVTMRKNNQELNARLINFSDQEAPLKYCYVSKVSSGYSESIFALTLPGGITIGTSEQEMQKIMAVDPEYFTDLTTNRNYDFGKGDQRITIKVDAETEAVYSIEVGREIPPKAQ